MIIRTKNNFTKWFTKHSLHAGLYIKHPGLKIEQYFPLCDLEIHTEYRNIVLLTLKETTNENIK